MKTSTFRIVAIGLLLALATNLQVARAEGKHLFILSGQSNMARLNSARHFNPHVENTFGKDNVICVRNAWGGQPIRRWYKKWKPKSGSPQGKPAKNGDLYDKLMKSVMPAIKGQKIKTVTFIWMQGERDAKEKYGEVYSDSLKGLITQLSDDLKHKDINFVLGRLSDFDMKNRKYPHWTMVRDEIVKIAEASPRGAWVNTDDLNDMGNKGKTWNDLHYTAKGYATLGKRFADAAIKLIAANKP